MEPMLRFKADDGSDFPDWEEKTLGDICMYERQRSEGANFVGTENMLKDFGGVTFDNSNADGSGTLYYPGDTLMSNIRPYLKKAWLADRKGTCSTDVLVFHPTSVEPGYLYWLIASDAFVRYVMSAAKGSKMPRGDKKHIMEMPLLLPNKDEQRKIADLLSTVDDVIAAQEAEVAAWQERKKGVMQKLFSQEVRFKADDGSDFPDWEEKTLGELGCFCSGVGFSERYQGHANLPVDVYKVSDMNISGNEREMLRANNTVDESILKKMKTKAIDQPSIIFAKVGAAIFAERKRIARKPFIVDNNMMVFTPNDENDFEYIYWLTLTLRFASRAQIGALPSYNASDISGFVVNIPSLPEQRKIADCLASLDDVIAKAKDELDAWKELKKGLLQQMFV